MSTYVRRRRAWIAWLVSALIAAGGGYLLVSQPTTSVPTVSPIAASPLFGMTPGASVARASVGTPSSLSGGAGLPNSALTPGALNPDVTQATIGSTICQNGWTITVRLPSSYTSNLKVQQLADPRYGDTADQNTASYEEDHLIPLELGGSPTSPQNLWPEPWTLLVNGTDLGAHAKDQVETRLKREVCAGTLTLAVAQQAIATDWETAP